MRAIAKTIARGATINPVLDTVTVYALALISQCKRSTFNNNKSMDNIDNKFEHMTLLQLKDELRKRKAKLSGRKAELVERLV